MIRIRIFDRFETVGNYPALYIDDIDTLVLSDFHLGMESRLADSGVYMPKFQLEELKEELDDICKDKEPGRLVICGDVKHEFSEASRGEREEVKELVEFLSGRVEEIFLVKGNHDNYLIYAVEDYDNVRLETHFLIDNILFIHGDSEEVLEGKEFDFLVMGHEHPAVTLEDEIGVSEKIPCFLYGENESEEKIIVLPAFSKLAEGSRVNITDEELASPVLSEVIDVGSMRAIGVDREAGLFHFPELREMSLD